MISQTAQYALRAMVLLAHRDGDREMLQAEEIADTLDLPRNYLSKILHGLTRHGLLDSSRGRKGGFRLVRSPSEIPLGQIVEVFDPQLLSDERQCLLGRATCSDEAGCPAHDYWKEVSRTVRRFFLGTTLEDLTSGRAQLPGSGGQ